MNWIRDNVAVIALVVTVLGSTLSTVAYTSCEVSTVKAEVRRNSDEHARTRAKFEALVAVTQRLEVLVGKLEERTSARP